jgi:uncharacterized membrane protein
VPGFVSLTDDFSFGLFVRYPLVPWIGVMVLGYLFGALAQRPPDARRRAWLTMGLALIAGFVVLRALNGYGDPRPWPAEATGIDAVIAFLNTQKYPPSLMFLCMTLGPAITSLAFFDRARGRLADALVIIGRVPLFFYIAHLYLLHAGAVVVGLIRFGPESLEGHVTEMQPETIPGLWAGYLAWIVCVVLLYPACRWFAGIKQRHNSPWLSYL